MRKKIFHIGIFWANPYSENLGVGALAYSIIFILEKISEKEGVTFKYYFINNKGKKNDILKIGSTQVKIKNYPYSFGMTKFKSWIKFFFKYPLEIFNILKFNVVVDIGEGDSFSDIYGGSRFKDINATKQNLTLLGKKLILLPQTIGPFNCNKAKQEAVMSLNKAHLITTRDKQSYDYVKELLPDKPLYEIVDMAFFLPYKVDQQVSSKMRVGINVSGLIWNGGYTKNNQFNLKSDYQNIIHTIIQHFLNIPKIKLELVAHVILKKDYHNVENDLKICNDLHKIYPQTKVAPAFSTPIEAKSYISGFDFFTGSRMHACIAAFSSGVPVFPLGYSRKFNGLFGDTLNYKYYGDLVNSSTDDVLNDLKSAFNNRAELKEIIRVAQQTIVSSKESELIYLLSESIIK
jgi:colanic acid/amylovoran biosynthesis protein